RRSVCPRCGSPVGVPVQNSSAPELPLELMTPAERVHEQMRRLVQKSLPQDAAAPAFGIGTQRHPVIPAVPRLPEAPAARKEESGRKEEREKARKDVATRPKPPPVPLAPSPPLPPSPSRTLPAAATTIIRSIPLSQRHYCARCRGRIEGRWYICLLYP